MPRQHRPERPGTRVLVSRRRVPRMHNHRHPLRGQQAPHIIELRVSGGEPAHLQVDLEDPRSRLEGVPYVSLHSRLGVERRRRQAPRRGPGEGQGPGVQVNGHVRPVGVRQRAEHSHTHGPQVRHPLLVAPLVPDRPRDSDQRAGPVEVLPHPAQHPRRQEVGVDVGQPRDVQRLAERWNVRVLLRLPRIVHHPIQPHYRMAANRSRTFAAVWSAGAAQTSALKISTSTYPA
jgi:hypothetical protein